MKFPQPCEALSAIRPVQIVGGEQTLFAVTSEGKVSEAVTITCRGCERLPVLVCLLSHGERFLLFIALHFVNWNILWRSSNFLGRKFAVDQLFWIAHL